MVDLTNHAIGLGVPLPTGVVLALPLAISADGSTVAGVTNTNISFVVDFPSPVAPGGLPGILGVAAALRRR